MEQQQKTFPLVRVFKDKLEQVAIPTPVSLKTLFTKHLPPYYRNFYIEDRLRYSSLCGLLVETAYIMLTDEVTTDTGELLIELLEQNDAELLQVLEVGKGSINENFYVDFLVQSIEEICSYFNTSLSVFRKMKDGFNIPSASYNYIVIEFSQDNVVIEQ